MKLLQHTIFLFLLSFGLTIIANAQNLNGEKIQVAADALTVLKFNSEIKRYELGDRDGYACQVRDNDNSIVIKTLQEKPTTTNLVVTEGKRTHYFVINFLPKIDLNNTRLYYDYSDLKLVRKLAESNEQAVALNENKKDSKEETKPLKEEKNEPKETAKERKRKEKEAQKLADEERKKQELEKQELLAQQKREQEKIKEDERKEQEAKEAAKRQKEQRENEQKQKEEVAKQKREQEQKDKLAKEEERIQQQKEQQAKITAAKEAERQRKAEAEANRIKQINDAKEAAKEEEKERQRLAAEKKKQDAEAKEAKRIEAENQRKLAAEQEKARKEQERQEKIAKEQEKIRKKEEAEKARLAAEAAKTEYTHAELWKKYPKIVFGDPPEGQQIAGEYYLPEDTLKNYNVAQILLAKEPWINNSSEKQNEISITLQGIIFSGVNCYMRFLVKNESKKDFLVGKMNLNWNKENIKNINLYPCYVTGYPVVLPGKEKTIIYASRAVNAGVNDKLNFNMKDRLLTTNLSLNISGADYNLEMKR